MVSQGHRHGKTLIFQTNPRHVTPQIDRLGKRSPVLRVFTHIYYGSSKKIDGKVFIFQSKPKHVTPQIDRLSKTSSVLRVSTHIYGVSQEIDVTTCSFFV